MKLHKYILLLSLTFVSLVNFAQDAKNKSYTATSFKVFGACEQCKTRIELAVKLKGVKTGIWDVDSKILTLEYDPSVISLEKIQNHILAVGHDLENQKAKDIIFNMTREYKVGEKFEGEIIKIMDFDCFRKGLIFSKTDRLLFLR